MEAQAGLTDEPCLVTHFFISTQQPSCLASKSGRPELAQQQTSGDNTGGNLWRPRRHTLGAGLFSQPHGEPCWKRLPRLLVSQAPWSRVKVRASHLGLPCGSTLGNTEYTSDLMACAANNSFPVIVRGRVAAPSIEAWSAPLHFPQLALKSLPFAWWIAWGPRRRHVPHKLRNTSRKHAVLTIHTISRPWGTIADRWQPCLNCNCSGTACTFSIAAHGHSKDFTSPLGDMQTRYEKRTVGCVIHATIK